MRKLDKGVAARVFDELDEIAKLEDPRSRGKALTGNLAGVWRYRVGDWKSVDWNALAAFIAGHADEISACGTQPLDTDGASKRLREWEKAKRQQV